MISLILYLLIGTALLASVGFAMRPRRAEGGSNELVKAKHALSTLRGGLLPPELVARIFDREDLRYVESHASKEVRNLFLEERKQVVLSWIGRVRQQVRDLKSFHLGSARYYAQLSLATELSLAVDFAKLLFACRVLQLFVQMHGPYAAPRIVVSTAAAATKVCNVSEKSLAFLTPVYAGRVSSHASRSGRF